ncbi:DUF1281 family ferredoxin-like fold protein [Mucilaginibacter agri]|uniref:YubB ferredoxin-like domain-containing protein n=1 Tax=Mucilaginibacter agri TaxID=2695265 RepID=A0A966DT65_9SPHI|nr:hypothetical protein [Mucilaginibacter agri]NCD69086.1 hypothetical protein [Mucilaginibacter agri]
MGNWCSNTFEFIGEHSQFEQLGILFRAMEIKEKKEEKGQVPDFVKGESGFMFQICWKEGLLYYQTKWQPNLVVMVKIADYFNVGFIHNYTEPGNSIRGEACYKDGLLTNIYLNTIETDGIRYHEEGDYYELEGFGFDAIEELLDFLLVRKKMRLSQVGRDDNSITPR